jgi:transcriptional regulator MraZ
MGFQMTGDVQPFISTVTGTLDAKGRVCIPSAFRDALAATSTAGVYVMPSFSESVLECFGADVLNAFHRKQAELDPFFSKEYDDKARAVLAMTQLLPRDENGRVVLPAHMIAHAQLKDRVTFVGMGNKFQIWDSEKFAAYQAELLKRALALRNGDGA